ncbi:MAG: acyl-CoA thioesterase [bacterium]|nr:acyl-CoA thioesterase [bacterium]
MISEIEIKVRGYHLDMFSHVNNARYLEFLEEGRWSQFEDMNLTMKTFAEKGVSMVVANINISYKYPAGVGSELIVRTEFKELRNTSGLIEQKVFLKGSEILVIDAEITVVFIGLKTGKPAVIDDEFRKMFDIK